MKFFYGTADKSAVALGAVTVETVHVHTVNSRISRLQKKSSPVSLINFSNFLNQTDTEVTKIRALPLREQALGRSIKELHCAWHCNAWHSDTVIHWHCFGFICHPFFFPHRRQTSLSTRERKKNICENTQNICTHIIHTHKIHPHPNNHTHKCCSVHSRAVWCVITAKAHVATAVGTLHLLEMCTDMFSNSCSARKSSRSSVSSSPRARILEKSRHGKFQATKIM